MPTPFTEQAMTQPVAGVAAVVAPAAGLEAASPAAVRLVASRKHLDTSGRDWSGKSH